MAEDTMERGAYIALGMLFGAAAGVTAGMLLAPRSGQETRDMLRERAQIAKEKAQVQRDKLAEKFNSTLEKTKKLADKTANTTEDILEESSELAKDATRSAQAKTGRLHQVG